MNSYHARRIVTQGVRQPCLECAQLYTVNYNGSPPFGLSRSQYREDNVSYCFECIKKFYTETEEEEEDHDPMDFMPSLPSPISDVSGSSFSDELDRMSDDDDHFDNWNTDVSDEEFYAHNTRNAVVEQYERYCFTASRRDAYSCGDFYSLPLCKGCQKQDTCTKVRLFHDNEGVLHSDYFKLLKNGWDVEDELTHEGFSEAPVARRIRALPARRFSPTHFSGTGADAHKTNGNIDANPPSYSEVCVRSIEHGSPHVCQAICSVQLRAYFNMHNLMFYVSPCLSEYTIEQARINMTFGWHFPHLNTHSKNLLRRYAKDLQHVMFYEGGFRDSIWEHVPIMNGRQFTSYWQMALVAFAIVHDFIESNFVTPGGFDNINDVLARPDLVTSTFLEQLHNEMRTPEPDIGVDFDTLLAEIHAALDPWDYAIQWLEALRFRNCYSLVYNYAIDQF